MVKEMVLYDAPEAATFKEGLKGWVSREGQYWGNDEHMARWCGATHKKCETCGSINEIRSYCRSCHDQKMDEKFDKYPVEKWDGETPLCLFNSDTYFFDDAILDYLADNPDKELRICKCKPNYLGHVNEDNWCDDLPEDGELPDEVVVALEALNKAILEAGPVSWYEDEIAIDVADLKSRLCPINGRSFTGRRTTNCSL